MRRYKNTMKRIHPIISVKAEKQTRRQHKPSFKPMQVDYLPALSMKNYSFDTGVIVDRKITMQSFLDKASQMVETELGQKTK